MAVRSSADGDRRTAPSDGGRTRRDRSPASTADSTRSAGAGRSEWRRTRRLVIRVVAEELVHGHVVVSRSTPPRATAHHVDPDTARMTTRRGAPTVPDVVGGESGRAEVEGGSAGTCRQRVDMPGRRRGGGVAARRTLDVAMAAAVEPIRVDVRRRRCSTAAGSSSRLRRRRSRPKSVRRWLLGSSCRRQRGVGHAAELEDLDRSGRWPARTCWNSTGNPSARHCDGGGCDDRGGDDQHRCTATAASMACLTGQLQPTGGGHGATTELGLMTLVVSARWAATTSSMSRRSGSDGRSLLSSEQVRRHRQFGEAPLERLRSRWRDDPADGGVHQLGTRPPLRR